MFRTPLESTAGKKSCIVDIENDDERSPRKTFLKFGEGDEMGFGSGGGLCDALAVRCRAPAKGSDSDDDEQ
jgi:hypothetical protein